MSRIFSKKHCRLVRQMYLEDYGDQEIADALTKDGHPATSKTVQQLRSRRGWVGYTRPKKNGTEVKPPAAPPNTRAALSMTITVSGPGLSLKKEVDAKTALALVQMVLGD